MTSKKNLTLQAPRLVGVHSSPSAMLIADDLALCPKPSTEIRGEFEKWILLTERVVQKISRKKAEYLESINCRACRLLRTRMERIPITETFSVSVMPPGRRNVSQITNLGGRQVDIHVRLRVTMK